MQASVIIIVKNRHEHLKNLLWGLNKNNGNFETIVVHMNEAVEPKPQWFDKHYTSTFVKTVSPLPLAEARNKGASIASNDLLIFLDVDCIPYKSLVEDYINGYKKHPNAVLMGEVYYLSEKFKHQFGTGDWQESDLRLNGTPHPVRRYLKNTQYEQTDKYYLFWSLNFALSKHVFSNTLNGFEESYQGYGGEDTDFAFKAKAKDVPLFWLKGATAFHQHHHSFDPPLHHFNDIIKNSTVFKERWGRWPMEKWLSKFVKAGYIHWNPTSEAVDIIKKPSNDDIENARVQQAYATG